MFKISSGGEKMVLFGLMAAVFGGLTVALILSGGPIELSAIVAAVTIGLILFCIHGMVDNAMERIIREIQKSGQKQKQKQKQEQEQEQE